MDAGHKLHPAEKALFQCGDLGQVPQLVQQDHLRGQRPQRHLDRTAFGQAADAVKGITILPLRRKKFPSLVDHSHGPFLCSQFPGDLPQKGGLAAVRFSHQQCPDEMSLQKGAQLRRKFRTNWTRNAEIQRQKTLQHNILRAAQYEPTAHPHTAAGCRGQVALRQFGLMGMY